MHTWYGCVLVIRYFKHFHLVKMRLESRVVVGLSVAEAQIGSSSRDCN